MENCKTAKSFLVRNKFKALTHEQDCNVSNSQTEQEKVGRSPHTLGPENILLSVQQLARAESIYP